MRKASTRNPEVEEQKEVKMMMTKNKPLGIEKDESGSVFFRQKVLSFFFWVDSERWMMNHKER